MICFNQLILLILLLIVILQLFAGFGYVANQASLSQRQHCSPDGVFGEAGAPDRSIAEPQNLLCCG